MNDRIVRAITKDGYLSIMAAEATETVKKGSAIHGTSPAMSILFGRALVGAAMMGALQKNSEDVVSLIFEGERKITVISDSSSNLRGYMSDPFFMPENTDNALGHSYFGNEGFLTVIKDLGLKEPVSGKVNLVSGEIAEDITSYYMISEQTPSVSALGVLLDTAADTLPVKAAGGYMVRVMPGCPDKLISEIETSISVLPPVSAMLSSGMRAEDIISAVLYNMEIDILGEDSMDYRCNCSRKKTENALLAAGKTELLDMANDPVTAVECRYCNKKYDFSSDEILALANRL